MEEIVYDNKEISGFYICHDDPFTCDGGSTLVDWVEVAKESVTQVDKFTLTITIDEWPEQPFSMAYAWRETPVERYLGLPVYGSQEQFSLPSPPWKKFCFKNSCS